MYIMLLNFQLIYGYFSVSYFSHFADQSHNSIYSLIDFSLDFLKNLDVSRVCPLY